MKKCEIRIQQSEILCRVSNEGDEVHGVIHEDTPDTHREKKRIYIILSPSLYLYLYYCIRNSVSRYPSDAIKW